MVKKKNDFVFLWKVVLKNIIIFIVVDDRLEEVNYILRSDSNKNCVRFI